MLVLTLKYTVQNLLSKVRNLSSTELSVSRLTVDNMYTSDLTNYTIDISTLSSDLFIEGNNDEYNYELFNMIYNIISSGKDTYNVNDMEEKIDFFFIINKLSLDMCSLLFDLMSSQNETV